MPSFDWKFTPVVTVTKSQLLRLAFDEEYRDEFIRWLSEEINVSGKSISAEHRIQPPLDYKLQVETKTNQEALSMVKNIIIPKLLFYINREYTRRQGFLIGDDWKLESKYNDLFDIFSHSQNLIYNNDVLKNVVYWLHDMYNDSDLLEERLSGLVTIVQNIINEVNKFLKAPLVVNEDKSFQQDSAAEVSSRSQIQIFLQKLVDIKVQLHNTHVDELNDSDFKSKYQSMLLHVLNAVRNDIYNKVDPISGIFTDKQEALEKEADRIYHGIEQLTKVSLPPGEEANLSSDVVLKSISALEQARNDIFSAFSASEADETEDSLNNTLLNAHQFTLYKTLALLPPTPPSTSSLKVILADLLNKMYLIGSALEITHERYTKFLSAKTYVDAYQRTQQRKKEKELEAARVNDTLEYDFEEELNRLIRSIQSKESRLEERKARLFDPISAGINNRTSTEMTAVSSLFGLDAVALKEKEAVLGKVGEGRSQNGFNALLTITCDFLVRYLSRFFSVLDPERQNSSYYIDFRLYENDLEPDIRVATLPDVSSDPRELLLARSKYQSQVRKRQTDGFKIDVFKLVFQKYFLPFLTITVGPGETFPYRAHLHRLDKSQSIFHDLNNSNRPEDVIFKDSDWSRLRDAYGPLTESASDLTVQVLPAASQVFNAMNSYFATLFNQDSRSDWVHQNTFELVEEFPLAVFRKALDSVVPTAGWYSDEMRDRLLLKAFTDDQWVKYKKTLEKLRDNIRAIYTSRGGLRKDRKRNQGGYLMSNTAEFHVKRQIVMSALTFIEKFFNTRLGKNILYKESARTPGVIALVSTNPLSKLEHVQRLIAVLNLTERQQIEFLRRLFRGEIDEDIPVPIEPFVEKVLLPYKDRFRLYLQLINAPADRRRKQAKNISQRESEFNDLFQTVATTYNIPDFLIARYSKNASPADSLYLVSIL